MAKIDMDSAAFEMDGADCPNCGTHFTKLHAEPIGMQRGANPQRYLATCPKCRNKHIVGPPQDTEADSEEG